MLRQFLTVQCGNKVGPLLVSLAQGSNALVGSLLADRYFLPGKAARGWRATSWSPGSDDGGNQVVHDIHTPDCLKWS